MPQVNKTGATNSTSSEQLRGARRKHSSDSDITPTKPAYKQRASDFTMALKAMEEKLDQIMAEQKGLKQSLATKLDKLEKKIKDECTMISDTVTMEMAQINNRLTDIETKVLDVEKTMREELVSLKARVETVEEDKSFDVDVTVVCYNIPYDDEEDLDEKATELVRDGLGLNLPVVRTMRTPRVDGSNGVVKIQFQNKEHKIAALRNKNKLNDTRFSRVRMRSSQTHVERIANYNTQILLKELKMDDKYRISGNGRLVSRDGNNNRGNGNGDRQAERGGGRGGRGRGRGGTD